MLYYTTVLPVHVIESEVFDCLGAPTGPCPLSLSPPKPKWTVEVVDLWTSRFLRFF